MMKSLPLLFLSVLLVACKSNPYADNGPPPELRDTLRLYENVVRWGDLNRMYAFGEARDPQPGLSNVRVTRYEIVHEPAETRDGAWEQTVSVQYVLKDRQVVKAFMDRQVWSSPDNGETWRRTSPHPQFW